MRQLNLDRFFSVFEAVLLARHGLVGFLLQCGPASRVVVIPTSKQLPRPGFGSSERDFPRIERVYRRRTKENGARSQGMRGARPGDLCRAKRSILRSGEQFGERSRKRGSVRNFPWSYTFGIKMPLANDVS